MKPAFWARRSHKWIGMVVGVQALLWMASGSFMAIVSLDPITEARLNDDGPIPLNGIAGLVTPAELSRRFPDMTSHQLRFLLDTPVFELERDDGSVLVDARSGDPISPLTEPAIRAIAQSLYKGDAHLRSIEWLDKAPREVGRSPAPMWVARYADEHETTLYISPTTGKMLAHRHDLWRWFDTMWMLHIMDYEDRADSSNTLLRIASILGLVFCFSGIWLLLYSFSRRLKA